MTPQTGELYRHYKSATHRYEIVGMATDQKTDGQVVVYRALYDIPELGGYGALFTRPIEMFFEAVEWEGKLVPRFTKVEE